MVLIVLMALVVLMALMVLMVLMILMVLMTVVLTRVQTLILPPIDRVYVKCYYNSRGVKHLGLFLDELGMHQRSLTAVNIVRPQHNTAASRR
jgi:hypothetical protein